LERESLATSLKALGLEKDSLEIKRIATVMQDVLVGRADNVSLERAMVATKAEIEKLRGMGREEEAVQLEAMLRAMEEAQAAQVKKKGYTDQWDKRFGNDAESKLNHVVRSGKLLSHELLPLGMETNAAEIERIMRVCSDVLDGHAPSASIDQAIADVEIEIAKLQALGKPDEAAQLGSLLEDMITAREDQRKCQSLRGKQSWLEASDATLAMERKAAAMAARIEAGFIEDLMPVEASQYHKLRQGLESGLMSHHDLESESNQAKALSIQLKAMDKRELGREVESFGELLMDTRHMSMGAAISGAELALVESLDRVIRCGSLTVVAMQADGLMDDGRELDRIIRVCRDVLGEMPDANAGVDLAVAIKDAKDQVANLRAQGKDAVADEFQGLVELMETARNSQLEANSVKRIDAYIISEIAACKEELKVADAAAMVEAHLLMDKLPDEAGEVHHMRLRLESGDITDTELHESSVGPVSNGAIVISRTIGDTADYGHNDSGVAEQISSEASHAHLAELKAEAEAAGGGGSPDAYEKEHIVVQEQLEAHSTVSPEGFWIRKRAAVLSLMVAVKREETVILWEQYEEDKTTIKLKEGQETLTPGAHNHDLRCMPFGARSRVLGAMSRGARLAAVGAIQHITQEQAALNTMPMEEWEEALALISGADRATTLEADALGAFQAMSQEHQMAHLAGMNPEENERGSDDEPRDVVAARYPALYRLFLHPENRPPWCRRYG